MFGAESDPAVVASLVGASDVGWGHLEMPDRTRVPHPWAKPASPCQMEAKLNCSKAASPFPARPQHWAGRDGWKVQTTLDGEMESRHFMQTLPWPRHTAAWARGGGDGQRKVAGSPGAWRDRAPGEGARAALGRDVHQGRAWQKGTGSLQDGGWGLGLEQERAPELVVRPEGPRALVSSRVVMMMGQFPVPQKEGERG